MTSLAPVQEPEFYQEQFDRMLDWLDADRDKAGVEYERIRGKLIRIFGFRGAVNPQDLADRTIDRVVRKLPGIQGAYGGEPANYFTGVAGRVYLEAQREPTSDLLPFVLQSEEDTDRIEREHARLENCMGHLSPSDRNLVLSYYAHEDTRNRANRLRKLPADQKNAEHRKKLAEDCGLTMTHLRVRVTRIRNGLFECVSRLRSGQAGRGKA